MARIRTIKPQFFTSETIGSLSMEARLAFVGLWTHVDDEGRCVDNPKLIRAAVFPLDDIPVESVEAMLGELASSGLIARYQHEDHSYLVVTNWKEHQAINHPRPSAYPPAPVPSRNGTGTVRDRSRKATGDLPPGIRKGNIEREGIKTVVDENVDGAAIKRVFDAWSAAANKPRAQLSAERVRLIGRRLAEYPEQDLTDAVKGWRNSPHHRGENDTGTVYNDLDLILRDAKHVEMFRDLSRGGETRPPPRLRNGERTILAKLAAGNGEAIETAGTLLP